MLFSRAIDANGADFLETRTKAAAIPASKTSAAATSAQRTRARCFLSA